MKKIILPLLLLVATCSIAQDMQQYLSETKTMVKEKKYGEALERYIWFQNHSLEKDRGMTGVRGSSGLMDWKTLGDVYPPAITAMVSMRDQKTKLASDSGSTDLFGDVVSLNRTLKEENKTITLFQDLANKYPQKAKLYWIYAKDVVFTAERYDIIKEYIKNPLHEFSVVKANYELISAINKTNSATTGINKLMTKSFVEKTLRLIKYSEAINDVSAAKEIRERAIAMTDDKLLRDL